MKLRNLFYLSVVLFFASCGNSESIVDSALKDQILLLGNGTEPQDLDPHTVTGVPEHKILLSLMEGLVTRHPEGKGSVPGVAERWVISEDGKEYTFYLNKKAKWSNGDSVTANDFVYSWKRILMPSMAALYADMLYVVKNAEAYNRGEIGDFTQVGVKAIDDFTLKVSLNNSTPYFLALLSHYSTWPVHKPTIEKFGEIDTRGTKWTRPENFVGNGPYLLAEWKLNDVIIVKKNPLYWNADIVTIKEIRFYASDNDTTEDLRYRAGQLHLLNTVKITKIQSYKTKYPDQIHIDPYFGTYYYRINTQREHLKDKRFRQALSYAINRKEIVETITRGEQAPAFSFSPPDPANFYPSTKLEFNPSKSKELFKEMGYGVSKELPKLEILYNTSEGHQKLAEAVQSMWKEYLGLEVELVNVDWKTYLDREKNADFLISRAGWIGDYPDPNSFLDMMVTGRGNNKTSWSNLEYDNLIKKAASATSTNLRNSYFDKAEHILMDELPLIPIYTYTRVYLLHPSVKGYYPNILDTHPYQFLRLENTN